MDRLRDDDEGMELVLASFCVMPSFGTGVPLYQPYSAV